MEIVRKLWDLRILLAVFLIITSVGAVHGALEWDEGSFLTNAEYFSGDESNFEESRPAALSMLIAVAWLLTGENAVVARLLVSLFGVATIYVFHRLASHEFDDALPVTAVFAFAPLMLYWSFHVYTDVPALMFVLASVYMYRRGKHLAAGALISVASTFRYIFFVFAIGMAASYIIDNRKTLETLIQKISRYTAGGLLGALPFLSYSYLEYGRPWSKVVMYVTRVSEWSDSGLFAATLPNIGSGVYMLSSLIPAAYTGWRDTPTVEKGMIVSYALFIIFVSGMSFQRYWLAILPFMLLAAYRGLDRRMFAVASVVMILLSAFGVGANYTTQQECTQSFEESLDYVSELEGKVVTDSWAVASYRLDREVYSPWTSYEELRDDYNVRYAVVSQELSYELLESFADDCKTYYVYDLREPSS